ncbi:spherulation-specific family 4 protein [Streptomyces cucumeris]|uniref:spherulation-specific family 4 protein n=1 Tax=Streptomyces cucumeris TaxID=2962890 RepID=UPI0020C8C1F6|nr:spherulation-specific family 4 protein [Streptomyces sp. NEAU-Y11]MCP9207572.1 spherulation-specific family 4 protein [Streptomyces sp. NEAU-Y11]
MTPLQRRLLVPLYVHPAVDPHPWKVLERAAGRLYGVVLNLADGPGRRPDAVFAGAAARLRAAGAPLLGYVDTAYGHRRTAPVLADIGRYRRWYGVDGVFLDRVPSAAAHLARYQRQVRAARTLGARTVVLNPGTHPDPGYAALGDLLITFEGCWETYRHIPVPGWTAGYPPERFCHLVYAVPVGRGGQVADSARRRGAAVHCAVPGDGANPWQSAPDGLE